MLFMNIVIRLELASVNSYMIDYSRLHAVSLICLSSKRRLKFNVLTRVTYRHMVEINLI